MIRNNTLDFYKAELTEEEVRDILYEMEVEELQVNKFDYIKRLEQLEGNIMLYSKGEQSYIKEFKNFEFYKWLNNDGESYLSFGSTEHENGWLDIKESDVNDVYGSIDDTDEKNVNCDVTIVLKSKNQIRLQVA